MKSPADARQGIVWLPVPATCEAGDLQDPKNRLRKSSGSSGSVPVLFLDMPGGDLFIRCDGAVCLYLKKTRDNPAAKNTDGIQTVTFTAEKP